MNYEKLFHFFSPEIIKKCNSVGLFVPYCSESLWKPQVSSYYTEIVIWFTYCFPLPHLKVQYVVHN